MDPLPPIPTPPSQRWREFRIQALPVLTFIAVLVCVAVLWSNYVVPTNMVGEVESTHAVVISGTLGTLKEVKIQRFQRVKAGDEIARISTMDSETLQTSLRAIEGDLKVLRARMQLDIERNIQSYQAYRMDYLNELVDLNLERVRSRVYDAERGRLEQLLTNAPNRLTDFTTYDAARLLAETARTNIVEREKYLAEKEQTLPLLAPSSKADDAILEAIKAQEEALMALGQPASIKAPIDGMVTSVACFAGQKVVEDTPLFTISATTATRIVAYVRRPYDPIPKPGDSIQIRRQSFKREMAHGTVLEVSGQLEPIGLNLLPATTSGTNELGLPFSISIPAELALLPGETVELLLNTQ
ncbi:MAG TPA: HlyD family efflux transporter periplasmic adaptor subunit [Methylomirabilota bacterium]|nr:HlyD family efflux transporter periplasmic adaptor subunit [Methylomirabilota bacterium]